MHPVGRQAQKHVAPGHAGGQVRAAFHRADGEPGKVEVPGMIHARHFRRLPADQRAARAFAAQRDAFDDARGLIDLQLAGGEIVEEEQRLRALADQIVHAHRDKVDADGVNVSGVDGDAQLGPHAVGCRNEDRIAVARALQVEKRTEPAEPRHGARPRGAFGRGLDPLHQVVARVDIDAGVGIGDPV